MLKGLRRTSRLRLEVSFDEPLNTDWDGNELLLSDILGTESDLVSRDLDSDVERQMLYGAIKRLGPREKNIVRLRYGLADGAEHTQKEVADLMGISQSYISRLEKRIIQAASDRDAEDGVNGSTQGTDQLAGLRFRWTQPPPPFPWRPARRPGSLILLGLRQIPRGRQKAFIQGIGDHVHRGVARPVQVVAKPVGTALPRRSTSRVPSR
jgi:DNA-binding CsgD family transcriptional regulator